MSGRIPWLILLPLFAAIGCGEQRVAMTSPSEGCQLSNLLLRGQETLESGVVLRACPVKDRVLMEEPIQVLVAVLNLDETRRKVGAHFSYGDWLQAFIVTSAGDTVEQAARFHSGPRGADVAVTLAPGGFVGRVVDITCRRDDYAFYDFGDSPRKECGRLYTLPPGKYSVTMVFSYLCDGDRCPAGVHNLTTHTAPAFDIEVEEGVYRPPPQERPRPQR